MKRDFVFASAVNLALAASGLLMAESDPFVGMWKLNLAKSKYDPAPPPKNQTRTWESAGKVSVEDLGAAGKPVKYGYTIKTDSKDYPTTGAVPNGADTVSTKRIAPTPSRRISRGVVSRLRRPDLRFPKTRNS